MVRINLHVGAIAVPNIPTEVKIRLEAGKSSYARLDYNENLFGTYPLITSEFEKINPCHYPSFRYDELLRVIADRHGIYQEMVYVSNGSDAILESVPLLFACVPNAEVIIPAVTYERMRKICQAHGTKVVSIPLLNYELDLKMTLAAINENTRVIYLVNPNMPTGTIKSAEEIEAFLEAVPLDVLVIIDQAYVDYVDQKSGYLDEARLLRRHGNLMFLRSFSKYFGLAAFRVGYLMASDTRIVDAYVKVCQSLPVGAYAASAARIALKNEAWYQQNVFEPTLAAKEYFMEGMYALGIPVVRSQGNFVYVDTAYIGWDNIDLRSFLLLHHDVSVRPVNTYGMRITIGPIEQMDKVLAGLKAYLTTHAIRR